MKIASFNIENIFHRNINLDKRSLHESIHAWVEEFEALIASGPRGEEEISRMRELSFLLGFHKTSIEPYVVMRRKAGQLYLRKRNFEPERKAAPLNAWNGWVKLMSRPINQEAIKNKAKVISDIDPDILILQEVEDRQSLIDFNDRFLPEANRFSGIVLMSGNDTEGRELGLLLKQGYYLKAMRNYACQYHEGEPIFDKDLQEYDIVGPKGRSVTVLSTLLQDPSNEKENNQKRKQQALAIAAVYRRLTGAGKRVVLAGSLNSYSFCSSLSPLLRQSDLKDVKRHAGFSVELDRGKDGGYFSLGAYKMGVNIKQRDYLLASPDLFSEITSCGLHRRGTWPEKRGQWRCYSSIQMQGHQASSHPALWMDL